MAKEVEEKKGSLLTQMQFLAVFGVEPGMIQRWIKFGMPVEGKQSYDLVQVGQWIVRHLRSGYMTTEEVAQMFGLDDTRTIRKWKDQFGLPQADPGFYKRDDVVKWRVKYLEKKLKEVQSGGADGMSQSTRLKRVQSQRQELRLRKEAGALVEIDKVIPIFEKLFALQAQRRKLFSKRTNPQLDGVDSFGEREKILNENIDGIFTDIYETGIRELNRLRELSGQGEDSMGADEAAGKNASKRTRKRKTHTQRRNK
ncbi:MAG: hypothetical protein WDA75_13595 [Candidatus Latescibacterota bacterium]|jgi:phage terminase Nu1 subunit (DNA packaging protein)